MLKTTSRFSNLPCQIILCAVCMLLCSSLCAQNVEKTENSFSPPPAASTDTGEVQHLENPMSVTTPTTTTVTPRVKSILTRLEASSKDTKTAEVEFEETIVQARIGDKTESAGTLLLQMPATLRLDYTKPAKTILLFTKNVFYQYEPELKQVNYVNYPDNGEAQKQLRMLMLGFGFSSDRVLENYTVVEAQALPSSKIKGELGLTFTPTDADIQKVLTHITVWFDEKDMRPRRIQYEKTSGDQHFVTVKKIDFNKSIANSKFDPDKFGSWISKPSFIDNTKDFFPDATPSEPTKIQ